MPDLNCGSIRRQPDWYPGCKVGFVLYRLTYSDNVQWAQFMHHPNTRIRLNLEEEGDGDLVPYIDWDVQEDLELQDAEQDEVRRRFQKYLEENGHSQYGSQSKACIIVPQFILDQVLDNGPPPETFDSDAFSCVEMISIDPKERPSSYRMVGLSYVFPRVYSLLGLGWHQINVGPEDTFAS